MTIASGTQLGHYEILSPIGAGGMGEVWRARDTRLNREVAIKVLPASLTNDEDRLRRFEQEALATSALNHPNILTVHDFGTHEGSPYIVAELLEGEELRQQLNHGPIASRKAIEYALQISSGLAAAHAKAIVHRDLKPENIFITTDGRVKILDFGLAKLRPQSGALDSGSDVQTQRAITDLGVVMGTIGYMSPEQVRGQEADHRADIFSFGVILYEMLSGKRTFQGESAIEVMNAILKEEPPELGESNASISPGLDKIVRRCLEKKPEMRFHSAHDLCFALGTLTTPSGSRLNTTAALPAVTESEGKTRLFGNARLAWIVAAVAALVSISFAVAYFRRTPAKSHATFSYLPLPEKTTTAFLGGLAISPDGRQVVVVAVTEGVSRLWLYSFERSAPVLLAGTEGARFPFWSPNGRSIGFFTPAKLKRIESAGGMPTTLCDATGFGGAWSSAGAILFAPEFSGSGLYRISESGGTATPVTSLDVARFELGHLYPSFLPDGRHFVFFSYAGEPEYSGIRLGSLDSPQTTFLLRADSKAEYSTAGYLLFVRGRKILTQQFDPAKLVLSGDPVPVTEQVDYELATHYADLSVFDDQVLLYRSGGNLNTQLFWRDRNGGQLVAVGPVGEYRSLKLSPDGGQVLLERTDPQLETTDVWQFDLFRETLTRLTSNPASENSPIWSPDGNRIVFASNREGFYGIYQKGVSGDDKEELLLRGDPRILLPIDWSSDGKFIVYRQDHEKTGLDIAVLPLSGDRQPRNYLATEFAENWGTVSPDGRWLAYQSSESGRFEIYVQSFPVPGRKVTVSKGGGSFPRWRSDGKELYYVSADDRLWAAPVETGASFSAGTAVALFELGNLGRRNNRYVYDASIDGQRLFLILPQEDASTRPLTVVQNWTAELKK